MTQGLAQYGNGFLAKFEAASCANKLLEEVTLVDTPGVLSGEKQRIERTYNFIDVCGWFAARCDLILLLFDPHKLDISDEFKQVTRSHSNIMEAMSCCAASQANFIMPSIWRGEVLSSCLSCLQSAWHLRCCMVAQVPCILF